MKKLNFLPIALLLGLCACGGTTQTAPSQEEQAEIETAIIEGRGAARRIINENFTDSMALHAAVLQANSERSKYEIAEKPRCAAAYDSAFIATIRTVRPELAAQLEKK